MKQTLILNYLPMDLNRYINLERANKFAAAKIKKDETESVYYACKEQRLKSVNKKVSIVCIWYVKNRKKDPDGIAFAKKYILDGLVMAGVLSNDGFNNIGGLEDKFILDNQEQVIVDIIET